MPVNSLLYSLSVHPYSAGSLAGMQNMPLTQKMFLALFEVIQKIARQEDCVIVGRCADYALRSYPDGRSKNRRDGVISGSSDTEQALNCQTDFITATAQTAESMRPNFLPRAGCCQTRDGSFAGSPTTGFETCPTRMERKNEMQCIDISSTGLKEDSL